MNYAILTINQLVYRFEDPRHLERCEVWQLGRWWRTDIRGIERSEFWRLITEEEAKLIMNEPTQPKRLLLHRLFPRYYSWWNSKSPYRKIEIFIVLAMAIIIAVEIPAGWAVLVLAAVYLAILIAFILHIRRQPLP